MTQAQRTILIVMLFLSAITLAACGEKAPAAFERPPAPVSVAVAETQDVPVYLDEIGKFVAREVVSIQPQVSGRITQIYFTDGADLKAGQTLFTIDDALNITRRAPATVFLRCVARPARP